MLVAIHDASNNVVYLQQSKSRFQLGGADPIIGTAHPNGDMSVVGITATKTSPWASNPVTDAVTYTQDIFDSANMTETLVNSIVSHSALQ